MKLEEFKSKARADRTIFTITFVKRTTGEVRVMNARFRVTKHLHGGSLPYNPKDHNLLGCYDVKSEGYRMINLDQLISLKAFGKLWTWNGTEFVESSEENS